MARIRSIHPTQWTDEEFVGMSFQARLFSIALRNECDDNGIFEWKPIGLKMRLMPVDNIDIESVLTELIEHNQIRSYEINGRKYGAVRNFTTYQRPKKPNSLYPMTQEIQKYIGMKCEELPTGTEPVPHQFPTGTEKVPQMEDGVGEKKEKEIAKAISKKNPSAPKTSKPKTLATKLSENWQLPVSLGQWACDEFKVKPETVRAAADRFRDYWLGEGKAKADWPATWRNWCRREDWQKLEVKQPKPYWGG